ncbi:MAG: hypothetical protein ACYTFT_17405, partial [Planctomycetota bacterium]
MKLRHRRQRHGALRLDRELLRRGGKRHLRHRLEADARVGEDLALLLRVVGHLRHRRVADRSLAEVQDLALGAGAVVVARVNGVLGGDRVD